MTDPTAGLPGRLVVGGSHRVFTCACGNPGMICLANHTRGKVQADIF